MTARHCVADAVLELACDASGAAIRGGEIRGNHPANAFAVFVGPDRTDFFKKPPAARAAALVDG